MAHEITHCLIADYGSKQAGKHDGWKLVGLFLDRDADYRTLLGDVENQYQEEEKRLLPDKEAIAEEIVVYYFHLVWKSFTESLSDYVEQPKVKKTTKKNNSKPKSPALSKVKTKKVKRNSVDYYACLTGMAQAGFPDKITSCCRSCKQNAPALNVARRQELQQ
ncbi:hypothetical protein C1645_744387 [Glomus cerebriforme]|uniref:SprT-like domain-containing protein n=1 Tax=Glomus cerebriforme TaxID=658196 RepID=A0A397S5D8_9GLOM|nr:hypothetical protein C1645_744387 [Glomus cerebriforme]